MIHIKTTYHPSGRYTCMSRQANDRCWKDSSGKLFGNTKKTDFYEEVGLLVRGLQSSGDLASYDDQASSLDR
ncbi:hypothetical protein WNY61_12875 [Sulfitobacter sp. AS92]|uniref:hypothetical protein n=1 Tax=Sulfitobacter sp. AS92 TaxID=3135783 RepID=UPI00317B5A04